MPLPCRHISLSIACDASAVYRYAANPQNLLYWASGLSSSEISLQQGEWVAESPMGTVTIRFAKNNTYGVLDHYVTLADGTRFYNPMRVFANGDGCEVVFTLFEQPVASQDAIEADAATILKDLRQLKKADGRKRLGVEPHSLCECALKRKKAVANTGAGASRGCIGKGRSMVGGDGVEPPTYWV